MNSKSQRLAVFLVLLVGAAGIAAAATMFIPVTNNADGTVLTQPGGPSINLTGNFDAYPESGNVSTTQIQWNTSKGNASFSSSGSTEATIAVSEITGPWTNLSAVDASAADLTVNPGDKAPATVGGSVTAVSYRPAGSYGVDDGTTDFVYSSGGSGTITLNNLPASTTFRAATSSGDDLGEYTTDGSGTATISVQSGTNEDVYLFTNDAPIVDNSSADPADGDGLSEFSNNYSIDIADADFATTQGDSVTATLYVDGSSVGSDTLSSNGTAEVTASISDGGEHQYHWEVSDNYGATTSSQTFTVYVPDELRIYDEENPDKLLDNVTANVTIYESETDVPTIYQRNTSDGTLNMTGLPANEPLIVSADAPGHRPRRIFVPSLFETQRIYLLPNDTQYTDVIFSIEDYSGQFPQESTVLEVQRGINGSWQTVLGDYFGATGQFPAQLAYNVRHRLVLVNTNTGEERVLGTYTPLTSRQEEVTVSPSGEIQPIRVPPKISVDPAVHRLVAVNGVSLSVGVTNGTEALQSWGVDIYYINGSTNTTLYNHTDTTASGGTVNPSLDLAGKENGTVKVVTHWTTANSTGSTVTNYSVQATPGQGTSLLESLGSLVGLVPAQNQDSFTMFLSLVITVIGTTAIASTVRMPTETIGVVALGFLTVFGVLGWISYNLVFVGVVSWGAISFLRRGY